MVRVQDPPWYIGLESLKGYLGITSNTKDERFRLIIGGVSRMIEDFTGRRFYPTTELRKFDWQDAVELELEYDDLLSITTIADDSGSGTVDPANVILEPANTFPKYRLVIDTTAEGTFVFTSLKQQAIHITGDWGYNDTQIVTGETAPAFSDTSGVSMAVGDGSLLEVGWSILIESERMFIENVATVDSTANTSEVLDEFEIDIDLDTPTLVFVGEVIRIDNEDMKILRVDSGSIQVNRGYNGTTPSTHVTSSDVNAYRNFTVQRGLYGSTAATHALDQAISRLAPPSDIEMACGILVARMDKRGDSGFSDVIGSRDLGFQSFKLSMPADVAFILNSFQRSFVDAIGI